jgi:7-cyano-7-deazaguanine synthase in queuosine biosynthesis
MSKIDHGGWKNYQFLLDNIKPSDTILFMYTGGLDSTTLLYKLLQETNCNYHVHHVHIRNKERRARVEQFAALNTVEWMRNQGHAITYSDSLYQTPFVNFYSWDLEVAAFHAAQVCYNHLPRFIVYGMNQADDNPFREDFQNRLLQSEKIFRAATSNHLQGKNIDLVYSYDRFWKETCLEIPEELRQLTWTCRTPLYEEEKAIRCGECKSCKELKEKGIWDKTPNELMLSINDK